MPSALAETIYLQLLDELLSGNLSPGRLLNRREIASRYRTSVSPVTEALARLELEGFVAVMPRKGTQVKPISQADIFDAFILRDAVETKAARMYFGSTIHEHADSLTDSAAQVDSAPERYLQDWNTEIAFHRTLIALSGSRTLMDTYNRAMQLSLFYGMNQIIPQNQKIPRDDHVGLIQDLAAAGTADEAEARMREHVWYGKEYLLKNAGFSP